MDRLELLVQFYRYLRDGETISRKEQFRKHVDAKNFSTPFGKFLAKRFKQYFESDEAKRTDMSSPLWPVEQKLHLVGKVAEGQTQQD